MRPAKKGKSRSGSACRSRGGFSQNSPNGAGNMKVCICSSQQKHALSVYGIEWHKMFQKVLWLVLCIAVTLPAQATDRPQTHNGVNAERTLKPEAHENRGIYRAQRHYLPQQALRPTGLIVGVAY
jgi:hypothetical protein